MRESAHKYFQMGLVSFMAFPACMRQPNEVIPGWLKKVMTDDFFDVIELNPIKDPRVRARVAGMLAQSHLKVCYGGHGRLLGAGLNPNDLDEAGRQRAEEALKAGLEEAKEVGAGGVAFLSGHWSPETREQSLEQLVKTTRNVCARAAGLGMRVELEIFDHDIDKKSLLGPAALAARFAAAVRETRDNFGFMVDLSHFPMCREDSRYILRTLRPYITHLHAGNTVVASPGLEAYGDEHPRFGFPGGENDTPELLEFLRSLKEEGFFNAKAPYVLSFEVKPWKDEDPDIVLANTKRVFHRAWALLEE